ncbi:phosphotransferase [Catelliglobosispora koreensis]|uniref:phosphotransferase n=1 Tax=Catelliglobosispora koreensis TaxID=129052 RepID=UPI00035EA6CD|nr:phosphotransferase [Catelliglobosispora koreensis]
MLRLLHASTHDLVPEPLEHNLDADPPWVAIECLPGTPLAGALTPAQLDALEVALRKLWSVPADRVPARRHSYTEGLDIVRLWFASAARPDGIAGAAFDATVEFLKHAVAPVPGTPVVGHSDPNLANYLWDGQTVRIVDFEDAGRSDVELELATMVQHLSGRGNDWEPFIARFDLRPEPFLFGRKVMAGLWIYFLLPGNGASKRNPPGTLDWYAGETLKLYGR